MKKVSYAGQWFTTTDAVAETLFDYVCSMDRHGFGESLEVPTVGALGEVASVRLLVWAGSELLWTDEPFDGAEPVLELSDMKRTAAARLSFRRGSDGHQLPTWPGDDAVDLDSM